MVAATIRRLVGAVLAEQHDCSVAETCSSVAGYPQVHRLKSATAPGLPKRTWVGQGAWDYVDMVTTNLRAEPGNFCSAVEIRSPAGRRRPAVGWYLSQLLTREGCGGGNAPDMPQRPRGDG
jgi:hypothetical protein